MKKDEEKKRQKSWQLKIARPASQLNNYKPYQYELAFEGSHAGYVQRR